MSLDDLNDEMQANYADMDDEFAVTFDRQTRNELALLQTVLDPEDADELVRRAIHLLFQSTVDTGSLDFHLRSSYDVTYDEYLSGMTFEEMTGTPEYPALDDERRYRF